MTVNPANDAPTQSATARTDTYTENAAALTLADSDYTLSTVEAGQSIGQVVFRLTNLQDPANEQLTFDGSTIALTQDLVGGTTSDNSYAYTVNTVGGTATVTFTLAGQSVAATEARIEAATYQYDGEDISAGSARVVSVQVSDSGGGTDTSTELTLNTITVAPVNDAPVNTVPGVQTVNEDMALAFTGAKTISVTDEDGNLASTQLSVANGSLNVTLQGAAIISGGLNGSNTLTIAGSEADINATLATLSYQGNLNYTGPDTLTVLSTDGAGVPLSDSDNVAITVDPVNDEPSLNLIGNENVNEDSGPHSVAGFATSASGGGADEAGQTFGYTVGNDNPGLFALGPAIDASGTLTYTLNPNVNGTATVTVSAIDSGGTANGGDDTSSAQNFTITVNPVNDAPSGADSTVITPENTAYVFSTADFGFSDPVDGDVLLAVEIATLPGAGTLTNNGVVLAASDMVSAVDIAAGRLVFTPATGASGAAYASFDFRVQDTGGTGAGGVDLDPTANRITIDVGNAPDPPVLPPIVPPQDVGPDPVLPGPEAEDPPSDASSPHSGPAESGPPMQISPLSYTGGGSGSVSSTNRIPVELDADETMTDAPEIVLAYIRSDDNAADADVKIPATAAFEPEASPAQPEISGSNLTKFAASRADVTLALDRMRNALDEEIGSQKLELGQSTGVAVGLSVGYVSWLLRGGVLLSSVLSSLPAWSFIDPLPVFSSTRRRSEEDDDESLQTIVEGGSAPDSSIGDGADDGRTEEAVSVPTQPDSKQ